MKSKSERVTRELTPLKEEMVSLAEDIQKQERTLDDLDGKIAILESEKRKKTEEMNARQKQIEASLASMVRLSKTPPEAVVAMPGEIGKTLKAGQILAILTENLKAESDALKQQLAALDVLEGKLRSNYEKREKDRSALERKQKELNQKIITRTRLQEQLFGEQRRQAKVTRDLARQAKNLEDLVERLEDNRKKQQATKEPATKIPSVSGKVRSFAAAKGALRLPASGEIIRRFGTRGSGRESSKGIELKVRANASVVAWYDGEVVFTGPFMDYGSMVIVRHTDGFHTLVAGLSEIQCAPGDVVREGEPIGRTGTKSPSQTLYLELRKNSRPVDPAPWIRS